MLLIGASVMYLAFILSAVAVHSLVASFFFQGLFIGVGAAIVSSSPIVPTDIPISDIVIIRECRCSCLSLRSGLRKDEDLRLGSQSVGLDSEEQSRT